jgi:hypothetical protein
VGGTHELINSLEDFVKEVEWANNLAKQDYWDDLKATPDAAPPIYRFGARAYVDFTATRHVFRTAPFKLRAVWDGNVVDLFVNITPKKAHAPL